MRVRRLLTSLRKTPRQGYLHFEPTEGREREAVKEPQTIEAYYKYTSMRDFYPETHAGISEVDTGDPYTNAIMYDWDNYQYKYHGEWWDTGPIFMYALFLSAPFLWGFLAWSDSRLEYETNGRIIGAGNVNWVDLHAWRFRL